MSREEPHVIMAVYNFVVDLSYFYYSCGVAHCAVCSGGPTWAFV